jgi:hypothetical protein
MSEASPAGDSRKAEADSAELHELDPHAESGGAHIAAPPERAASERILAGLWIERGAVQKPVLDRWRKCVLEGTFDAEACAREVLVARDPSADPAGLAERAGRLLRDFLMADVLRDSGRRARVAAKRGLAFFLVQGLVLALFVLLGFLYLVILRVKGVSVDQGVDGAMDALLSWLPG